MQNDATSSSQSYIEQPRDSSWKILLIVVLATFGGLAVLGVTFFIQQNTVRELHVTNDDREIVVRASDFDMFFEDLLVRSDRETLTKSLRSDVVELNYRYTHLDDQMSFELATDIFDHANRKDAELIYGILIDERMLVIDDDVSFTPENNVFAWGDQSNFCTLKRGSKTVGYVFLCRRRKKIYRVEFLGQDLGGADRFAVQLTPRLERLDDYESRP